MMRKRQSKMMVFGAPFEADAQLVKLEQQGLVDCILTGDGDVERKCDCKFIWSIGQKYCRCTGRQACGGLPFHRRFPPNTMEK